MRMKVLSALLGGLAISPELKRNFLLRAGKCEASSHTLKPQL